MTVAPSRAEISNAARQAWVGFWASCMAATGGRSLLAFDEDAVRGVLAVAAPVKPKAKRARSAHLKADLLDRLDKYQVYAARLRKYDVETYNTYRRLGAYVCTEQTCVDWDTVDPQLLAHLPSFGAVFYGGDVDTELIGARFVYFTKLSKPFAGIELPNAGVVYQFHVYWDDATLKRNRGAGHDFYVSVAADGMVRPLRVLREQRQIIQHRDGGSSAIAHQRWGLPLPEWSSDLKNAKISHTERIRSVFVWAINAWIAIARQSMIRVTASKGGLVMPFLVDVLKTPQFFRDREHAITQRGSKRKIFHIVRAHLRNGKAIKTHFSGLREFVWNGYKINITVPGREHADLTEFDVGMLGEDEADTPDVIDQAELADRLADLIGAPNPEAQAA